MFAICRQEGHPCGGGFFLFATYFAVCWWSMWIFDPSMAADRESWRWLVRVSVWPMLGWKHDVKRLSDWCSIQLHSFDRQLALNIDVKFGYLWLHCCRNIWPEVVGGRWHFLLLCWCIFRVEVAATNEQCLSRKIIMFRRGDKRRRHQIWLAEKRLS